MNLGTKNIYYVVKSPVLNLDDLNQLNQAHSGPFSRKINVKIRQFARKRSIYTLYFFSPKNQNDVDSSFDVLSCETIRFWKY